MAAPTKSTLSRTNRAPRRLPAERWVKQLKALADPTRLRITAALLRESLSVNELAREVGTHQYNISKHLRVLREAEIIDVESAANRRQYSISSVFRSRMSKDDVLDLGCCTLRFGQLASRGSR